jgi:hypothetical protein
VRSEKQASPPLGSHTHRLLGVGVGDNVGEGVIVGASVCDGVGVIFETGELVGASTKAGVASNPMQAGKVSNRLNKRYTEKNFPIINLILIYSGVLFSSVLK